MAINNTFTTPEEKLKDKDYRNYIVKYEDSIISDLVNINDIFFTKINDEYGILTVKSDYEKSKNYIEIIEKYEKLKGVNWNSNIFYVKYPELYKLQETSPIEAAKIGSIQTGTPLNLTGKGILVGIVDTGIDYLNNEFVNIDGKTRINFIWDQTIENKAGLNRTLPFGTEYNKADINNAIDLFKQGKDPYSIVPSKDEIGHGTNMAGIIGASGINKELEGIAPECELCIVKLIEATAFKNDFNINIPIFDLSAIIPAIIRLYEYSLTTLKPMVIYLPLGSNSGNHNGDGLLNELIENVANSLGIVVVTGSGNEGDRGGHTSGIIQNIGDTENIDINVSMEQKTLVVEIWIDVANIMSVNIISPSGEDTGVIPVLINNREEFKFIFEKVSVQVSYFIPEAISGQQLILVYFKNLQPGIWKIRLTANAITDGVFNAWLPVQGITLGDTAFIASYHYGTFTTPGDTINIVTVAAYNQNNNNTLKYSGVGFKNNKLENINIAAGGVNQKTIGPNNRIDIVSGTSVSAAIVSGVCALLFQWGIVDGNFPAMYSESLITFLVRGTDKRRGDIYPNAEWGYGILDVFKIFSNIP
ncbi:MAG: S8 family peptidase [Clostridium sp.]